MATNAPGSTRRTGAFVATRRLFDAISRRECLLRQSSGTPSTSTTTPSTHFHFGISPRYRAVSRHILLTSNRRPERAERPWVNNLASSPAVLRAVRKDSERHRSPSACSRDRFGHGQFGSMTAHVSTSADISPMPSRAVSPAMGISFLAALSARQVEAASALPLRRPGKGASFEAALTSASLAHCKRTLEDIEGNFLSRSSRRPVYSRVQAWQRLCDAWEVRPLADELSQPRTSGGIPTPGRIPLCPGVHERRYVVSRTAVLLNACRVQRPEASLGAGEHRPGRGGSDLRSLSTSWTP